MELPGEAPQSVSKEKVLIWGAGGSVGGYAVQYAKSVGYTGMIHSSTTYSGAKETSHCNGITTRVRALESPGSFNSP